MIILGDIHGHRNLLVPSLPFPRWTWRGLHPSVQYRVTLLGRGVAWAVTKTLVYSYKCKQARATVWRLPRHEAPATEWQPEQKTKTKPSQRAKKNTHRLTELGPSRRFTRCAKRKVPEGVEPSLAESESAVITVRPWNRLKWCTTSHGWLLKGSALVWFIQGCQRVPCLVCGGAYSYRRRIAAPPKFSLGAPRRRRSCHLCVA